MGRYDNTSITVNRKGERVRIPTLYPEIPLSDSDQFVFPKDGDRLDNIAFKYYGDASLWWIIAKANELGKGRTILNPNFQIRVPGNHTKIIADFNNV